ncbi:transcription termination factor NusA [Candidatus Nomurabacteria bacterium RIFCSPLOWO2_01_FULL_41_21]|uniref:Transcription termination/antitermination protein NusA n=2 Tax=Candidatus Nomuraibacteriota TaxID=1752729 RepID=A0A1F6X419_9BACT|nr:MAG: transcription termination factor NusA [Candidatus Nomurabacteria bacterium RIFCSPHIGHO2_01_FULL_40_24b]OGI88851.1 MAG: transcription termination factor NusA [Candidatus Nomurabacteria bacterium RIFCSPLOWO2_01_FULL_41_21]
MLDIKTFKSALEQLEEERKIPKEKILEAIEQAMAAAYKKDYGKKGQIIRAKFDLDTGKTDFFQVKIVVDETIARLDEKKEDEDEISVKDTEDERVHFNSEHHIMWDDAKKIKKGAELNDEIIFPLEGKDDYGRIAAQTAKQVIMQRIREAERTSVMDEYGGKEGEIVSGIVQKVERGLVYVDFNRATGVIEAKEQIPGEYFARGQRVRAYLYSVEDSPRGINLRLSRTHPKFVEKLFAIEAPEIEQGVVEIKAIAREAGARSKIAVFSNDDHIDPVGSCVGQKGTRVNTITQELGGEKIDIIPWSEDAKVFVSNSLSPAKVLAIEIDEKEHKASVEVADDQLSLAIGKGGQNVRLAAKLTGWRIDIKGNGEKVATTDGEEVEVKEETPTENVGIEKNKE